MNAPMQAVTMCGLFVLSATAWAQPRPTGAQPPAPWGQQPMGQAQPPIGQAQPPVGPAQPIMGQGQPGAPRGALTAAQLEELLGPIALYPDPLLANVLAACVYPDEVAQATTFLRTGGSPQQIDAQPWEPPVKAIAKVPEVLRMLGDFPEWTTALGQAYLTQAQDVMTSVQSLRQKAQARGALQTTPQQNVVVEQETIYIQPSDPEVVYVPSYSPSAVYVDDDDDEWAAGLIGFGTGVVVGAVFADLACDWDHGCIGWGNADIDIERNITTGDITIGDRTIGEGRENRARVGQEGGAWTPNRQKPLATQRPDQRALAASGATAARPRASSAARPPATSRVDGSMRSPGAAQPAGMRGPSGAGPAGASRVDGQMRGPGAAQPTNMRMPSAMGPGMQPGGASRVDAGRVSPGRVGQSASPGAGARSMSMPSPQRAQSAFQGGAGTRAASARGSSSRQVASRGPSGPPRGSMGGMGGGGRGGGRGGGGRR